MYASCPIPKSGGKPNFSKACGDHIAKHYKALERAKAAADAPVDEKEMENDQGSEHEDEQPPVGGGIRADDPFDWKAVLDSSFEALSKLLGKERARGMLTLLVG